MSKDDHASCFITEDNALGGLDYVVICRSCGRVDKAWTLGDAIKATEAHDPGYKVPR